MKKLTVQGVPVPVISAQERVPRSMAFLLLIFLVFAMPVCGQTKDEAFRAVKDGDIIFQISGSAQSEAIQLATQSQYSHCGIIFYQGGKPYVYEAVSDMRFTPLDVWVGRGIDGHYLLMRLKERDKTLTPTVLAAMRKAGQTFAKKRYDILFHWSDDAIYCSELVWKIYERGAGIRLAEPRPFKDYTLDKPEVRALIEKRYGDTFPFEEKAVAPSDLVGSFLLEIVGGNGVRPPGNQKAPAKK